MVRIADRFNVAGSNTFLVVHQALAAWVVTAKDVGNKRVHPGGGEEDGGVILRDERGTTDLFVVLGNKKIDEFLS